MKGWLGAIVVVSSLAVSLHAQDIDWNKAIAQTGKEIAIAQARNEQANQDLAAMLMPRKKEDDPINLAGQVTAATIADIETTMYGIRAGAHEGNPVMKPFVARGRKGLYPIQAGINLLYLYTAYKFRERGDEQWATIPRMLTFFHTMAAVSNVETAKHYQELSHQKYR